MAATPLPSTIFYLRWRGRQEGPFTLEAVRARLAEGQVGLLHEIMVDGQWISLGEYLQSIERQQREEQEAHDRRLLEEQQRQTVARQKAALEESQRQNEVLRSELQRVATVPPPTSFHEGDGLLSPRLLPGQNAASATPVSGTSGLAITAFVFSILNFVPGINFVSWILAIIFGHIALSNIKRTPGLGGQGLALAAVIITYALLGIGFIAGLLIALTARHH